MSDDITEPAIPIRAALPVQSIKDLLRLAEQDLGGLDRPGVRIDLEFTEERAARVTATVKVYEVNNGEVTAGAIAERSYAGKWRGGVFVQWTGH
jgi:hypothetical protein